MRPSGRPGAGKSTYRTVRISGTTSVDVVPDVAAAIGRDLTPTNSLLARARAELYARAAGLKVDHIVMIAEGGLPTPGPVPVFAMAKVGLADAATILAPGEQDITATVSVRFLLR